MSLRISAILLLSILAGYTGACDEGLCSTACDQLSLNGKCTAEGCRCYLPSVTCVLCDQACKQFDLDGDCDDDEQRCGCKLSLSVCPPWNCEAQCSEDPRAKACILVLPLWCVSYGPFQFCGCECIQGTVAGNRTASRSTFKVVKHQNEV